MNANSSIARARTHTPVMQWAVVEPGREALFAACAPWHARSRPGDRRLHLDPEQNARVLALIQARQFELATCAVRALPAATPELPDLLGGLICALAQAGEHDATIDLMAELLARFPLRPELSWLLVGLADIMSCEQQLALVFEAVGMSLRRIYGFHDTASFEWAQRLAYQLRRHGNAYASACILRTWRSLMMN